MGYSVRRYTHDFTKHVNKRKSNTAHSHSAGKGEIQKEEIIICVMGLKPVYGMFLRINSF